MTPPKTQWMWYDEMTSTVQGVVVDLDEQKILWYDSPGCSCNASEGLQTIADFIARGPSRIMPPADVLEEMRAGLLAYA